MKSNMHIHVARYSLVIHMIEDRTEGEILDTSVTTSSKLFEFSRANCGYEVAFNLFSCSESIESFTMIHQVTHSVSPFSECLKLFSDFGHISVGPSDVILLVVFDVRPLRKLRYLFVLSLGVLPSGFVAFICLKCMMRSIN